MDDFDIDDLPQGSGLVANKPAEPREPSEAETRAAAESGALRHRLRELGDQLDGASVEAGSYSAVLGDMRSQVQELQRAAELRYHLSDRIQELEAILEAREASLTEANAMVLELENAYRELQIQTQTQRQQAEEAQLKATNSQERVAFLERTLKRVELDHDQLREANATLRAESMNARVESSAVLARMDSLQRRHDELRSEHGRLHSELDTSRREFERQVSTLRSLYEAVQIKLSTLESVRNHLAGQNDGLRRENLRLKQQIENEQRSTGIEAEKWRLYAQSLEAILAENGMAVRSPAAGSDDGSGSAQISQFPAKR